MVDGRMTKDGECVVVDLDNTLIKANSTKILAAFLLCSLLRKGRLGALHRVAFALLRRKMRLTTHTRMKHVLVGAAQASLTEQEIKEFALTLSDSLNPAVTDIIMPLWHDGASVLIATAAVDFFIPSLIETLPFEADYVATAFTPKSEDYIENRGDQKLASVNSYLRANSLRMSVFITDNADDLPVLAANQGKNYVINPSRATIKALQGIEYERR